MILNNKLNRTNKYEANDKQQLNWNLAKFALVY